MFGNNLVAAAIVLSTASPTLAGSAYVQQIGSNNTPRLFATTKRSVSRRYVRRVELGRLPLELRCASRRA